MNYKGVMSVDPEKCTLCYACIRECPMNAIEAPLHQQYVEIIPDRCTACGSCYKVCPTRAIAYESDMLDLQRDLVSGLLVAAVIDPAIAVTHFETGADNEGGEGVTVVHLDTK